MKSKNKKIEKEPNIRRVRTKDGIEFTIDYDMQPSKESDFDRKKRAMYDELLKRAGLPNFPPYED